MSHTVEIKMLREKLEQLTLYSFSDTSDDSISEKPSKIEIEKQKDITNDKFFEKVLNPDNDIKKLLYILEHLGKLPPSFNGELLLPLISHINENVRVLAIKNLGKLENETYSSYIANVARVDTSTVVRREAVSAIGRLRNPHSVPFFLEFLHDVDSKVVLQAIRALLYFKDKPEVKTALELLVNHPNEHIQSAIAKEFGEKKKITKDGNHVNSPDFLKNIMVNGDVRKILQLLPDESVHLTFTSPPYYNARDYQLYQSYEQYLQFLTDIFNQVHRVTKEGRFFVLNTSPVIEPRMSRTHSSKRYLIPFDIHPRLIELGWEFIEDIVWLKPAPSAKNRNGGFYQHRKPLGYKANSICEYVLVYRKKTDKLIDWNMSQYSDEVIEASKVAGDYEKTNVWQIAPANDKVHPAIFPKELAKRIIQFYSMKGDLIFDPFGGVGTVGQAAMSLERSFFLTEKEPSYIEQAKTFLLNRLDFEGGVPRFFTLEEFQKQILSQKDEDAKK